LMRSVDVYRDEESFRTIMYLLGNRMDFRFLSDKFVLASPFRKRWANTDGFFNDKNFWRDLPIGRISLDSVIKLILDVLQDGQWQMSDSLEEKVRTRIPGFADAGLTMTDVREKLQKVEGVSLQVDQSGKWKAKFCLETSPTISNEGHIASFDIARIGSDSELSFLAALSTYEKAAGFTFEERDRIRIHTGIKLGLMTVLSGSPGCGKSSFARLYATALSGRFETSRLYKRVFVNRMWTSPNDLLGYPARDPKDGIRVAGNGLLTYLRDAVANLALKTDDVSEDLRRVYPVCFEELNLAYVEHYFSDFMQVLSDGGQRENVEIAGYADGGEELRVDNNVIFIGTCNEDNTVRKLSDRFLDRCNYVEMSASRVGGGFNCSLTDYSKTECLPEKFISYGEYSSWARPSLNLEQLKRIGLDAFYAEIKKYIRESRLLSLDARADKKIARYVCCRPTGSEDSWATPWLAFDEAFAQMVLSKASSSPRLMKSAKALSDLFAKKFGSLKIPEPSLVVDYFNRLASQYRDALEAPSYGATI